MRIHSFTVAVVCLALAACASKPSAVNTPVAAQCTKGVVATVANPRAVMYDIYYSPPGKAASIIGEVSPGSTVTFPLPDEGLGRVYVQRPRSDITSENQGYPGRPLGEIRIRVHCSGT